MKNGKKEGKYIWNFENGNIRTECFFKDGIK
jgi:antitoxin component YwqK of YwqJK toxin-antitoxin module